MGPLLRATVVAGVVVAGLWWLESAGRKPAKPCSPALAASRINDTLLDDLTNYVRENHRDFDALITYNVYADGRGGYMAEAQWRGSWNAHRGALGHLVSDTYTTVLKYDQQGRFLSAGPGE